MAHASAFCSDNAADYGEIFYILDSSVGKYRPFIVDGDIIGNVPTHVCQELESYNEVFSVTSESVSLLHNLHSAEERTCKINNVLESLRDKNIFVALKGWRNEVNQYRISCDMDFG